MFKDFVIKHRQEIPLLVFKDSDLNNMALTAVEHLVGMIVSELQNETSLLLGVNEELRELSMELVSMKSFLKDAETKQLKSEGENTWVANVRELAYQSQDIIDEFMYNLHRQHCEGTHFTRHFRSLIRTPKHLWMNHQIAIKLQHINKRIKAIPERSQRYGIDRLECSTDAHNISLCQRDASLFIKEEDVVGLKDEIRQLERWLMDEREFQQTLISVVGMGGSGKTTLVTRTYNNETVKCRFDCYGWLTVSQTYTREELFRSLIKEFHQGRKEQTPDLTAMDLKELVNMLINYLNRKRYLVVFDDVWDTNVWEAMKVAFPENQIGSRVILTTRKEDVGSFSSGLKNHILHIKSLNYSEAWDLFSRKAFSSYHSKSCPKELQTTAWELVDKCRGLPLAIVTMGGLMSTKKSITEWTNVYNSLNWQLSNNPMLEAVKSILLLSFNDLPYPLKHCFLYCCLFPEDYMIRRKRLIRLWIAEGFVKQVNRVSPKQVAEGYLMELIFRSMLQVVWRNEFGRPKACKMHDLLRELALSISENEKFCTLYDGSIGIDRCTIARRISIQNGDGDLKSYKGAPHVRSLLVFVSDSLSTSTTLLSKLKLLRILDLEGVKIDKLPDGFGILFNLRYLNLRGTKVAELPKSIQRLHNLETLDIRDAQIKELPKGMAKLKNLQHLITYRYDRDHAVDFRYVNGTRALFQISKLQKLEVLSFVEAEGSIIRQLGTMTQLTRMGISNLRLEDQTELCSTIQNLKKLQYLFLMASNEEEFLRLDALELPPPYLNTLILAGKLERVPRWFCSLENVTFLYLHWSRMKEDPLPYIAELPNLGRLELTHGYIGRELHFSKGFMKLTKLYLFNFPNVTVISIEKEVMPDIQVMHLSTCTSLIELPKGIEFLNNLETLDLPFSLKNERFKVQHVRDVYFW